jgi:phosphocarrier protein FPr
MLIETVCRQAGGATVAVCGELAADETATGLLVGLGVHELSVVPPAVAEIKAAVRNVDRTAVALAARVLSASGPAEVRAVLRPPLERPR